mmetsp:Transcript_9204/g.23203  ORF Transcript_9204/g.23203 Transcript_9204/m.23203 type:complete len:260 (-) Transcript_9204:3016-3795(-)
MTDRSSAAGHPDCHTGPNPPQSTAVGHIHRLPVFRHGQDRPRGHRHVYMSQDLVSVVDHQISRHHVSHRHCPSSGHATARTLSQQLLGLEGARRLGAGCEADWSVGVNHRAVARAIDSKRLSTEPSSPRWLKRQVSPGGVAPGRINEHPIPRRIQHHPFVGQAPDTSRPCSQRGYLRPKHHVGRANHRQTARGELAGHELVPRDGGTLERGAKPLRGLLLIPNLLQHSQAVARRQQGRCHHPLQGGEEHPTGVDFGCNR